MRRRALGLKAAAVGSRPSSDSHRLKDLRRGVPITSWRLIFPACKMREWSYTRSNGLTNKKVLTLEFYYISGFLRKLSLIRRQLSGLSREGRSPRISSTCYHGARINFKTGSNSVSLLLCPYVSSL